MSFLAQLNGEGLFDDNNTSNSSNSTLKSHPSDSSNTTFGQNNTYSAISPRRAPPAKKNKTGNGKNSTLNSNPLRHKRILSEHNASFLAQFNGEGLEGLFDDSHPSDNNTSKSSNSTLNPNPFRRKRILSEHNASFLAQFNGEGLEGLFDDSHPSDNNTSKSSNSTLNPNPFRRKRILSENNASLTDSPPRAPPAKKHDCHGKKKDHFRVVDGRVEKVKRYRPGEAALREIRRFQRSTEKLVPHAPFMRVVKEIVEELAPNRGLGITPEAIGALQEACEAFLVIFFEAANHCANHAKRVTLMVPDINKIRMILGMFNVPYFV